MARKKTPTPEPEPSRAQKEEYIRVVSGQDIAFSRYNDRSLNRLYGYARGVQSRGEQFDLRRGTGHPPKIQHHDYETKRMHSLPPHKEAAFRIPMLDDWYIGTCEHPPVLEDVIKLLNYRENAGAEYLYIAFVGYVEYADGHQEPAATSNNVSRKGLLAAIKRVRNVQELYDLLNPDKELDGSLPPIRIICQVSLRPAIERGGLKKAPPPAPKEPEPTIRKLTRKQREEIVKKHIEERKAQPKPKVKKPSKSVRKGLAKGLKKKKGKGI